MKNNRALKLCAIAFAVYLVLGFAFYFLAGDSLFRTSDIEMGVSGTDTTDELIQGSVIEQPFYCEFDALDAVLVSVDTANRTNTGSIYAEILDAEGTVLRQATLNTAVMSSTELCEIAFDPIENAKDKKFVLRLIGVDGTTGNAVSFLYGNTINAGRGSVEEKIEKDMALKVDGVEIADNESKFCALAIDVRGFEEHIFGTYYWLFYAGGALLLAAYLLSVYLRYRKGKTPYVVGVIKSLQKYGFLIRQLVARDFKTKYKRSVLGILWSFLNPLLTMSVQYVVFSYLFKSDIENFVVYLLTGIVCYNFFHEATNMCLMSIIGNAPLISKVYVPKYIYPFSRSLSSGINMLFSLVPLLICLFITRTPITPALLLLPFGLIMLFLLSYGVGLLLATMMVFFRDTQFLWGIMTMLLMYLTPIFYPETIIPEQFLTVYKLNPLYHILRFMRSILIDGVSLEPKAYLYCAILCIIPFLIGVLVFRKNEDKFVLNI